MSAKENRLSEMAALKTNHLDSPFQRETIRNLRSKTDYRISSFQKQTKVQSRPSTPVHVTVFGQKRWETL